MGEDGCLYSGFCRLNTSVSSPTGKCAVNSIMESPTCCCTIVLIFIITRQSGDVKLSLLFFPPPIDHHQVLLTVLENVSFQCCTPRAINTSLARARATRGRGESEYLSPPVLHW